MQNLTPVQYWLDETERNAYNAAFYELGLRWHWDRQTYCDLMGTAQAVSYTHLTLPTILLV